MAIAIAISIPPIDLKKGIALNTRPIGSKIERHNIANGINISFINWNSINKGTVIKSNAWFTNE